MKLPLSTLALLLTASLGVAQIPSSGLVAGYFFNGNANDSGPNLLHATNHGATLTTDRFGRANSACLFNGTSSYLEIADDSRLSLPTTGELSISVWLRPEVLTFPDEESSGYLHWMGKGTPDQHEYAFRMYGLDNTDGRENRTSFYMFSLSGGLGAGSYVQKPVTAGEWVHYVATVSMSADRITWYRNGVQEDQDVFLTGTFATTPGDGTAPLRIGTRNLTSYFQGAIDDVVIYNRVLTGTEIQQLSTPAATQAINDPFYDGNRSNTSGGDAAGAVWYQGQTTSALTVVDDAAGFGGGNALRFAPGGDFQKFVAFFGSTQLNAAGDTVRLNFDFRFPTAPDTQVAGLRFGLFSSAGTRQNSDTLGTTRNDDKGYLVSTDAGAAGTATLVNSEDASAVGGSDILGGSPPYGLVALGTSGGSVASGITAHHARMEIIRLHNGDLAVSAQIDALAVAAGTHAASSVLTYDFDELAIGLAGTGYQPVLLVDNVLVEKLTFPVVSVTTTGAAEGGSGTFTFTRNSTAGPLTIAYTLAGTAVAGLDYPAPSGTITFPEGVPIQTVVIAPALDRYLDPGDTIIATIAAGSGYLASATQGSATMTVSDATTSPYELLTKNPLPLAATNGFGPATRSVIAVTGQNFPQALRIVTPDTSANIYESGASSAAKLVFDQAVNVGDKLVVSLWARATSGDANGEGYLRLKVLNTAGTVSSGEGPVTVDSAWRLIQMPFKAAGAYAAGAGQLTIFAGYGPQTIEIGAVSVENHGNVAYSALGIPLYQGREANAAWRTAAAARIEQHRKADCTVQVRDAAGHAVPGASVHVKMKRHAYGFGSVAGASRIVSTDSSESAYLSNQKLRDTFLEMFHWAVFENDLKWPFWEPSSGTFTTTPALNAARWLGDHGVNGVRGHVFVWPGWSKLPAWLQPEYNGRVASDGLTAANAWLRTRVLDHITQQAGVVGSLATRWDVLNEPFTNHDLQDLLGRAEIVAWFQRARTAAPPGTPLVLNDYDNEGDDLPHINFLHRTIQETEQGQGATIIDGLGLQSHLDLQQLPSPDRVLTVLDRYAALGKQIEITEFDVGTDGDEQVQADYLRDYLTLTFSHPAVKSFLVWAFWEGAAFQPDRALYRTDWTIKPNGQAWRDLVHGAWWTDTTVTTDANGNATVRGFHGDYEISVTAGVRSITVAATLDAGGLTIPLVPRDATAVTLHPLADTYVQDDVPTTNFGTVTELVTKLNGGTSFNRDAYLKFDLTTVPEILSAKLRLRAGLTVVGGSTATYPVGLSACAVADSSWGETAMTWNNRPALGGVLSNVNVTGMMPSPPTQWVELDVTAHLQAEKLAGRNLVTLGLHNGIASNPRISIASRETAAPPELVITTPKGIALWRAQKFGANAGAAVADDLADPDGDAFCNLLEYALHGEPLQGSTAIAPIQGKKTVGVSEYLTLTFSRVTDAIDITYTVEATNTLENPASWQPVATGTGGAALTPAGGAEVSESGAGNVKTVEVRDAVAIGAELKRFLRLRIERP